MALGLQTVGLGFQVAGAMQESAATREAYRDQAAVERNNALLADMDAEDAILRGDLAVAKSRREAAQMAGALRADLGTRGVSMDVGSPLALFAGLEAIAAQDEATLARSAEREALGSRIEALNRRQAAAAYTRRAGAESPTTAGLTTLLGSGSQVAGNWYRYNNPKG